MSMLKKLGIYASAAAFLVAVAATPADAALVTFTTTGVFGSTDSNVLVDDPITITFTGVTETVDAADPGWLGSFGSFDITNTDNGSTGTLGTQTFTLFITQTAPPGGPAGFSATLHGQINHNNSNATLTFSSPLTQEIDGFFYSIMNAGGVVNLPAPGGSASIAGRVTDGRVPDGQVPEPAGLLLFGATLLASAYRLRRHRAL